MNIEYSFEIRAVDAAARVMEVMYTASECQAMLISMRLPFEGESLEAVVCTHAPLAYWEEQKRGVIVPEVGVSGAIRPEQRGSSGNANEVFL
jgi:hypothetical protein